MLEFLSCLVDRLAGLVLKIQGLLTVAIDVENPTCSPTSIEHCPHPVEADFKNQSLNPAIFNLTQDTFRLIFEHLDPPDQICLSLSCEPLYNLSVLFWIDETEPLRRSLIERAMGAQSCSFGFRVCNGYCVRCVWSCIGGINYANCPGDGRGDVHSAVQSRDIIRESRPDCWWTCWMGGLVIIVTIAIICLWCLLKTSSAKSMILQKPN